MNAFLQRHTDAEHPMISTVRAGVQAGTYSAPDPTRLELEQGIIGTYEVRARHLRRFDTPHASQLRHGVEALLEAAHARPGRDVNWWSFTGPDGRSVAFIECGSTHQILAAFTTVSRLDVTEEDWEALWGEPTDEGG